ncbi:ABC transporter ATP-binding protein [Bacillus suaedae]|uniref:ABC transporter ATP-binding protein n=1 Tax=Halalkalibacter suaedae TaxID=2822140 RepID=A0A941ANW5_9BACI|nr:ABC transporter ATP-binding protein [Bacillus suaedae]MBP3949543.1 ABC transporter ATP-binding protein [Bacillus suaedae]
MIEFQQLTKTYGSKTVLKELNLTLTPNKIYGLLGRNGAGKTTMMQLLAGHILPTNGKILINGKTPFNNRSILNEICFINESGNFKQRLKIKDALKIASFYYPNWSNETAYSLLEIFNLNKKWNVKGLSKGMESALGITIGLASRANITILDEPYIGLDASHRYKFYDLLLEEYENYPRTFILSTHLIDEVSELFEEIILIKDATLLLHKTTEEVKDLSLKINGQKELVEQFSKGKKILYEKEIIGQKTVILFQEGLSVDQAKAIGLDAERCDIQELMVYLTGEKERKTNV